MITVNNTATGQAGASSLTFSLTTNAGPNRVLVVAVAQEFTGVSVSGITYNSQALTQITTGVNNNEVRADLWYLIAPPVTTANVVVTCSGASNIIGMAAVFDGVDQANPINTNATNNGASGNASVAITPTVAYAMIVDCLASGEAAGSITIAAGQTSIYTTESSPLDGGMSRKELAVPAASSMGWTISGGNRWAEVAVALKPSPSGGFFIAAQ